MSRKDVAVTIFKFLQYFRKQVEEEASDVNWSKIKEIRIEKELVVQIFVEMSKN